MGTPCVDATILNPADTERSWTGKFPVDSRGCSRTVVTFCDTWERGRLARIVAPFIVLSRHGGEVQRLIFLNNGPPIDAPFP